MSTLEHSFFVRAAEMFKFSNWISENSYQIIGLILKHINRIRSEKTEDNKLS